MRDQLLHERPSVEQREPVAAEQLRQRGAVALRGQGEREARRRSTQALDDLVKPRRATQPREDEPWGLERQLEALTLRLARGEAEGAVRPAQRGGKLVPHLRSELVEQRLLVKVAEPHEHASEPHALLLREPQRVLVLRLREAAPVHEQMPQRLGAQVGAHRDGCTAAQRHLLLHAPADEL